eukprot:766656-Hanusia_phi.AAC.3
MPVLSWCDVCNAIQVPVRFSQTEKKQSTVLTWQTSLMSMPCLPKHDQSTTSSHLHYHHHHPQQQQQQQQQQQHIILPPSPSLVSARLLVGSCRSTSGGATTPKICFSASRGFSPSAWDVCSSSSTLLSPYVAEVKVKFKEVRLSFPSVNPDRSDCDSLDSSPSVRNLQPTISKKTEKIETRPRRTRQTTFAPPPFES